MAEQTYFPEDQRTTTAGGDGTFEDTNDSASFPPLSTFTILDDENSVHGIHLHQMTSAQLREFQQIALWSDGIADVKRAQTYDLVSGIIGCYRLPYTPNTTAGTVNGFCISGEYIDTPTMTTQLINKTFQVISVGVIKFPEYFGSFLDYAPYTKIQIYLPFIGLCDIPTELVMGGDVHVRYYFNNTNGQCNAYIRTTDRFGHKNVILSSTGNCRVDIPLTSYTDPTLLNITKTVIDASSKVIGTIIGAKVAGSASAAAGEALDRATDSIDYSGATNIQLGSEIAKANAIQQGISSVLGGASDLAGAFFAPTAVGAIGDVSGGMAAMSQLAPYVIITRPCMAIPENFEKCLGLPCNIGGKVEDFHGLTIFSNVRMNGIESALNAELSEIQQLLYSGVILPEPSTQE